MDSDASHETNAGNAGHEMLDGQMQEANDILANLSEEDRIRLGRGISDRLDSEQQQAYLQHMSEKREAAYKEQLAERERMLMKQRQFKDALQRVMMEFGKPDTAQMVSEVTQSIIASQDVDEVITWCKNAKCYDGDLVKQHVMVNGNITDVIYAATTLPQVFEPTDWFWEYDEALNHIEMTDEQRTQARTDFYNYYLKIVPGVDIYGLIENVRNFDAGLNLPLVNAILTQCQLFMLDDGDEMFLDLLKMIVNEGTWSHLAGVAINYPNLMGLYDADLHSVIQTKLSDTSEVLHEEIKGFTRNMYNLYSMDIGFHMHIMRVCNNALVSQTFSDIANEAFQLAEQLTGAENQLTPDEKAYRAAVQEAVDKLDGVAVEQQLDSNDSLNAFIAQMNAMQKLGIYSAPATFDMESLPAPTKDLLYGQVYVHMGEMVACLSRAEWAKWFDSNRDYVSVTFGKDGAAALDEFALNRVAQGVTDEYLCELYSVPGAKAVTLSKQQMDDGRVIEVGFDDHVNMEHFVDSDPGDCNDAVTHVEIEVDPGECTGCESDHCTAREADDEDFYEGTSVLKDGCDDQNCETCEALRNAGITNFKPLVMTSTPNPEITDIVEHMEAARLSEADIEPSVGNGIGGAHLHPSEM